MRIVALPVKLSCTLSKLDAGLHGQAAQTPASSIPGLEGTETTPANGVAHASPESSTPSQLDSVLDTPAEAPSVADVVPEGDSKEIEEFAETMKEIMKDKGDMFDSMVVNEEKIRLGETGWKARYYQVCSPCMCAWVLQDLSCRCCASLSTGHHGLERLRPVVWLEAQEAQHDNHVHGFISAMYSEGGFASSAYNRMCQCRIDQESRHCGELHSIHTLYCSW